MQFRGCEPGGEVAYGHIDWITSYFRVGSLFINLSIKPWVSLPRRTTTFELAIGKLTTTLPWYLVDATKLRIWPSKYSVSQLTSLRSSVKLFGCLAREKLNS